MAGGEDSKLGVQITAATESFRDGVDRAQGMLKGFVDRVAASSGVIGGFNSSLAALTAVLAGGLGFHKIIEDMKKGTDEVEKLTTTFGITTEAASELQTQLKGSQLTVEDYISTAQRFAARLRGQEAAFKAYGIATRDSSGELLDQQQIMQNSIRFLNSLKEGTDRNAASFMLLGKNMHEVTKFEDLMDEKKKARAKQNVEELGLGTSSDDIEMVTAYKNAMSEVSMVVDGLGGTIGKKVMPVLTEWAKWFREVGPSAIAATEAAVTAVMDVMTTLWGFMKEGLEAFMPLIQAFGSEAPAAWNQFKDAVSSVVDTLGPMLKEFLSWLASLAPAASNVGSAVMDLVKVLWDSLKTALEPVISALKDMKGWFDELAGEDAVVWFLNRVADSIRVIANFAQVGVAAFRLLFQTVKIFSETAWKMLQGAFSLDWGQITEAWRDGVTKLSEVVKEEAARAKEGLEKTWSAASSVISGATGFGERFSGSRGGTTSNDSQVKILTSEAARLKAALSGATNEADATRYAEALVLVRARMKELGDTSKKTTESEKEDDEAKKKFQINKLQMDEAAVRRRKVEDEAAVRSVMMLNEFQYATAQKTNQQYLADKLKLQRQIDAIEIKAAQDHLNLMVAGTVQYEHAMTQLVAARARAAAEEKKIENEARVKMYEDNRSTLSSIQGAWDSHWKGLLSGQEKFGAAFKATVGDMIIVFIKALEEMGVKWAAQKFAELGVHLTVEAVKTQATASGAAARGAVESTALAASMTTTAAAAYAKISAAAGETLAGVTAFLAPLLGPLAPAAAAPVAAETEAASLALASLAVGTWRVPRDMPTMVHEGEVVVPKFEAGKFRALAEAADQGGSPSRGGGSPFGANQNVSFGEVHVHHHGSGKLDARQVGKALDEAVRNRYVSLSDLAGRS